MEVIFMRVGIDSKNGKWNAPCNPKNRDFVYVPVPVRNEPEDSSLGEYYANDLALDIERFSARNHNLKCLEDYQKRLCNGLADKSAHLDPDFRSCRLSYGNSNGSDGRAISMSKLVPGDFVIFYNSMMPISPLKTGNLEYGIIGRLKVQAKPKPVEDITDEAEIARNIHTRRPCQVPDDVVVFGEPSEESGRLKKYLPIGKQWNNKNYYLRDSLVNEWGGICGKGIDDQQSIQMAKQAVKIRLCDPDKFLDWWDEHATKLIHKNNP